MTPLYARLCKSDTKEMFSVSRELKSCWEETHINRPVKIQPGIAVSEIQAKHHGNTGARQWLNGVRKNILMEEGVSGGLPRMSRSLPHLK